MTKKEYEKSLCHYPSALTATEAAEILRVSIKTIYKLIKEKALPAVKVGRENRIAKGELIRYLQGKDTAGSNPKCVGSENSPNIVWTWPGTCGIVRVGDSPQIIKGVMTNGSEKHSCRQRTG
jgi:excisionase family DNA binding protein